MFYNKIMYIQNKPAAAGYKLIVGALALVLEWYILSQYGVTALRLFPTWVLFIAAIYFLSSALILALSERRFVGKSPCPMVEGMLIIAFFLIGAAAWASATYQFYLPELDGWVIWLVSLVLPILTLFDWLLFVKKGGWHIMMPFYGLALPAIYVATMIFTAEILPEATELLHPLQILNLREFGLWSAIYQLTAVAILVVIFGYILYTVDFIMSGKLSRHIVLPHLKEVDVDEDGNEIIIDNTPKTTPATQDETDRTSVAKSTPAMQNETDTEPESEKKEIIDKQDENEKAENHAVSENSTESLSKAEKQAISDLDEAISQAIREEISKQEEEDVEETPVTMEEPTRVEVTKVVILEAETDEKSTSTLIQDKPKTQSAKPPKNHRPRPKSKAQPNRPKPHKKSSPQAKKSQNQPKITRY